MTSTDNIDIFTATREEYEILYTEQLLKLRSQLGRAINDITGGPYSGYELTKAENKQVEDAYELIKSVLSTRENILSSLQKKALRKLRSKLKMSEKEIRKSHHWQDILDIN